MKNQSSTFCARCISLLPLCEILFGSVFISPVVNARRAAEIGLDFLLYRGVGIISRMPLYVTVSNRLDRT